jgi:hypothetical protein
VPPWLAIGAIVTNGEALVINFSKALDAAWSGLDVRDPSGNSVQPRISAVGARSSVRLAPPGVCR